jgi:peroxin-1
MPHAASTTRPPSIPATVFLTPLKNCLLNLPASLVSVLVSQNTPAQNVVVEISFRGSISGSASSVQRTAYAGWTGMQSKRKPTAGTPLRSGDDAVIEMDPALARNIGVTDGTKVSSITKNKACS